MSRSLRPGLAVALALAALVAGSACGGGADRDEAAPDQGAPGADGEEAGGGGGAPEPADDGPALCSSDSDCEPAAATCCECATFALPVSDGYGAACEDVECGGGLNPDAGGDSESAACAPTSAVCQQGTCSLICLPVACDVRCESGFLADAAGCLRCDEAACAPPGPTDTECTVDEDCARVPADCCGCSRGGADTAVASDQVDEHIESLECDSAPACPGVNVCDVERVPRCFAGACELGPAPTTDMPPGDPGSDLALCGTPDLTCPAGTVCVLNDPEAQAATRRGLGVCRRP